MKKEKQKRYMIYDLRLLICDLKAEKQSKSEPQNIEYRMSNEEGKAKAIYDL